MKDVSTPGLRPRRTRRRAPRVAHPAPSQLPRPRRPGDRAVSGDRATSGDRVRCPALRAMPRPIFAFGSVHGQREALLCYSDVQTALGGIPEASERRPVRRLPELLKGPLANLPNPLPRHAEERADLFEGHGL